MTEEEKKAIKKLKLLNTELYIDNCNLVNQDDLKIALNLIEKQDKIINLMAEDFATQLWKLGVVPTRKLTDGTEVIIDKEELIKIYERKYNLIKADLVEKI